MIIISHDHQKYICCVFITIEWGFYIDSGRQGHDYPDSPGYPSIFGTCVKGSMSVKLNTNLHTMLCFIYIK